VLSINSPDRATNDDIAVGEFNSTIDRVYLQANTIYSIEVKGYNDRDAGDFTLMITYAP
jgi:hypothetical protein